MKKYLRIGLAVFISICFLTQLFQPASTGLAQTPSPTPSPSPTAALPQGGPGNYRLKEWDEEEAVQALQILDSKSQETTTLYHPFDYLNTATVFRQESALRFPDASARTQWHIKMFAPYMDLPYIRTDGQWIPNGELLRQVIERGLNRGEITTTTITGWLLDHGTEFPVTKLETVENLFGDGLPGQYFFMSNFDWGWLFAMRGDRPGNYQLYLVDENKIFLHYSDTSFSTQDVTGDGQAEILVDKTAYHNGQPTQCLESLSIYTFQAQQFQELSDDTVSNYTYGYASCSGFQIITEAKGPKIITSDDKILLACDEKKSEPVYIKYRSTFRWNGKRIERVGTILLPWDTQDRMDCEIAWAHIAGPKVPEAMEILQRLTKNWPSELDQYMGPAAQDYFRFKLGTWYAFLGQRNQAVKALESVRDQPANPRFSFAPQLANEFLKGYPAHGPWNGCQNVLDWFEKAYHPFQDPRTHEYDLDQMKLVWGFVDPYWQYAINVYEAHFSPNNTLALCSIEDAFQASIEQAGIQKKDSLIAVLYKDHLSWTSLKEGDLNNDGKPDWFVLVKPKQIPFYQLWAVIQMEKGAKAIPVESFANVDFNTPTAYYRFQPDKDLVSIHVYRVGKSVYFYRFSEQNNALHIDNLSRYPVYDSSVQSLDVQKNQIIIFRTDGHNKTITWDAEQEELSAQFEPLTQEDRLMEIGKILLEENDPGKAKMIIQAVLRGPVYESDFSSIRGAIFLPRLRPYLTYLLGLTYELTGDSARAVQTYYQLWKDYPQNPYALIAREKLELRH